MKVWHDYLITKSYHWAVFWCLWSRQDIHIGFWQN